MQTAFYPKINGRFKRVPFSDVLYISANKNYSEIFTVHKKRFCIYATLGLLEERLPENIFCRIHRSYLVPLGKIEEFDHSSVLIGSQELPIGKSYFEKLSSHLLVIHDESKKNLKPQGDKLFIRKLV